eukprot:TRINITY_DN3194_c0_g1_i3.p1 TRINITY_DN3194_c0_g1~~TRINITY_DN3194_c0_g1_i3.p1  ORF type:complete len:528 (+),score=133.28 TRINITY_DN3194_c0_g1_i3:498-2081(+)
MQKGDNWGYIPRQLLYARVCGCVDRELVETDECDNVVFLAIPEHAHMTWSSPARILFVRPLLPDEALRNAGNMDGERLAAFSGPLLGVQCQRYFALMSLDGVHRFKVHAQGPMRDGRVHVRERKITFDADRNVRLSFDLLDASLRGVTDGLLVGGFNCWSTHGWAGCGIAGKDEAFDVYYTVQYGTLCAQLSSGILISKYSGLEDNTRHVFKVGDTGLLCIPSGDPLQLQLVVAPEQSAQWLPHSHARVAGKGSGAFREAVQMIMNIWSISESLLAALPFELMQLIIQHVYQGSVRWVDASMRTGRESTLVHRRYDTSPKPLVAQILKHALEGVEEDGGMLRHLPAKCAAYKALRAQVLEREDGLSSRRPWESSSAYPFSSTRAFLDKIDAIECTVMESASGMTKRYAKGLSSAWHLAVGNAARKAAAALEAKNVKYNPANLFQRICSCVSAAAVHSFRERLARVETLEALLEDVLELTHDSATVTAYADTDNFSDAAEREKATLWGRQLLDVAFIHYRYYLYNLRL